MTEIEKKFRHKEFKHLEHDDTTDQMVQFPHLKDRYVMFMESK